MGFFYDSNGDELKIDVNVSDAAANMNKDSDQQNNAEDELLVDVRMAEDDISSGDFSGGEVASRDLFDQYFCSDGTRKKKKSKKNKKGKKESKKRIKESENQTASGNRKKVGSNALVQRGIAQFHFKIVDGCVFWYDGNRYIAVDHKGVMCLLNLVAAQDEKDGLDYHRLDDAARLLECQAAIMMEEPPIIPGQVLFRNGLYDLRNECLIEHSEDDFLIFEIQACYYPDVKIPTPVFDQFLETVTQGDRELRRLILAFLGYCLLPENFGKCFFVLGTAPNSGKSMLAQLLEALFGKECVSHITPHDMRGEFSLSPLPNKALNLAMDIDADILSKASVSKLKNLTGNDSIELNIKYEKLRNFCNRAKFVFGTNHPILLSHADDAFWNRLVFIPFNKEIEEEDRDPRMFDKLWAERDGIVRKAMKAAKRLIDNNYRFPRSRVADAIIEDWRYGRDFTVALFIKNYCSLYEDISVRTHTEQLYRAYETYCKGNHFSAVTVNQFSRILGDVYGLSSARWVAERGGQALRGFCGIELSDP